MTCYPNPFTDQIHVKMNCQSGADSEAVIQVFDLAGKLVLEQISNNNLNGEGEMTLNLGDRPSGAYVIQVEIGSKRHAMVIQKQ